MKPFLLAISLALAAFSAMAQDISASYYTGSTQKIQLKFPDSDASGSWRILSAGRTLASGDVQTGSSGEAAVSFSLPEMKSPASIEAELVWGSGGKESSKEISVHSANPFTGKIQTIGALGVGLWSVDSSKSPMAELLKKFEIPFSTADGISSFDGKLLFVEGMDFDNNPGSFDALKAQCQKGCDVILLPPIKGSLKFDRSACSQILLAGDGRIERFGRRLDSKLWGGAPFNASRFKWDMMDGSPCLRFDGSLDGFSYCEMEIGGGTLSLCGWDLAAGAKVSPTPLRILEKMIDGAINKTKEHGAK